MRKPIVAGQFYESDSTNLKSQIESCFESVIGPKLPSKKRNKKVIGVISPHAGYEYSGSCQAFSYKEIAESKIPDVYILFGLSHSGFNSSISSDDWETPLGKVNVDKELAEELSKLSKLPINEIPHQNEHSIEVQLPFLQFINKKKKFKILPIIISDDIDIKKLAINIKRSLDKQKKSCILIASSDFTHMGPNYNFEPFHENISENQKSFDGVAIKHIGKLDSDGLNEYVDNTGATICGINPITLLIETVILLGAKRAKLLKYYSSGDISGDYTNSVGYSAIKIE
jgi:MEMO1 family protein